MALQDLMWRDIGDTLLNTADIARAVPVITGLDEMLCPACGGSMSPIM